MTNTCKAILKSGKNKGSECGKNGFNDTKNCKKHSIAQASKTAVKRTLLDKYLVAAENVITVKSECINICKNNGITPDTLNIEDNIQTMKDELVSLHEEFKSKFNEYEPIIDKEKIKLLDDTVKYYKEVLDKLNYINTLKKIATVN